MSLSITALRSAKPGAKPDKLADETGLFLLVQPSGGMLWRFKCRTDRRDDAGNPKRVEQKPGLEPPRRSAMAHQGHRPALEP